MRQKWVDEHLDRYRMLRRLQLAALIGVVFIFVYALRFWCTGSFASILGIGILAAGASLLAGFLVGFVFGIPRTPKEPGDSSEAAAGGKKPDPSSTSAQSKSSGVMPNSNLVEISDWLTKIIVGVGLVQLNKIPGKVSQLSTFIGNGLRDCDSQTCQQSSEAVALVIMLYFFCAGFLIGYLWARLYLQKAFSDLSIADQVDLAWKYVEQADQAIQAGKLDRADALLDVALGYDPSNPKALMKKAYVLKHLAQQAGKPGDLVRIQEALDLALKASKYWDTVGGVFYNIACYQAILGKDKKDILANLARAFELDASLKPDAKGDDDLKSVWTDEDFIKLTS